MSFPSSTRSSASARGFSSTWQTRLASECARLGFQPPTYEMFSDRRGGRTAWSSTVLINGQEYSARYWYAGDHANNAREDAAEVALQRMGIVPTPRSPYAQQGPATR